MDSFCGGEVGMGLIFATMSLINRDGGSLLYALDAETGNAWSPELLFLLEKELLSSCWTADGNGQMLLLCEKALMSPVRICGNLVSMFLTLFSFYCFCHQ